MKALVALVTFISLSAFAGPIPVGPKSTYVEFRCEGIQHKSNGSFYKTFEVFGEKMLGEESRVDILETTTGEVKEKDPTSSEDPSIWRSPLKFLHRDAFVLYKRLGILGNTVQKIALNTPYETIELVVDISKPCLSGEGHHWTFPAKLQRTMKQTIRDIPSTGQFICRHAASVDLYDESMLCKGNTDLLPKRSVARRR